jgi:hypothetical protein
VRKAFLYLNRTLTFLSERSAHGTTFLVSYSRTLAIEFAVRKALLYLNRTLKFFCIISGDA